VSQYLVLLFPFGWLFTGAATFFLTRRASPRAWLWALGALVLYLVSWRILFAVFYSDVPSPAVLARAFEDGVISLRAFEEGRDRYHEAGYVVNVLAVFPPLLLGIARRFFGQPPRPAEVKRRRRRKKREAHEPLETDRDPRAGRAEHSANERSAEPNVYAPPAKPEDDGER